MSLEQVTRAVKVDGAVMDVVRGSRSPQGGLIEGKTICLNIRFLWLAPRTLENYAFTRRWNTYGCGGVEYSV